MQIVNNAMHIVCILAGHFCCIHPFRTVGDSNPVLIINYFWGKNRACLRMFTNSLRAKMPVRFLLAGGYFFMSFFIRAKAALSSSSSGSCA